MIHAGVDRVKSSRNAMVSTNEIVEILSNAILDPGFSIIFWSFLATFLGEVIAPIPSTLVFVAPLVLLQGELSVVVFIKLAIFVAMPMAVGTVVGSYLLYGIAYYGGKPAIQKFRKYLGFSWEDIEKLEGKFKNNWYDEGLFLLIRSTPLVPTVPLNVLAGLLRMNIISYSLLTFLGTIIKVMVMVLIIGLGGGNRIIEMFNL